MDQTPKLAWPPDTVLDYDPSAPCFDDLRPPFSVRLTEPIECLIEREFERQFWGDDPADAESKSLRAVEGE